MECLKKDIDGVLRKYVRGVPVSYFDETEWHLTAYGLLIATSPLMKALS